jgi:hypothetical protein
MSNNYGPRIVTDGLVLCLDAADRNSYPGSGSVWYNLAQNNRHYNKYGSVPFLEECGGCWDFTSLSTGTSYSSPLGFTSSGGLPFSSTSSFTISTWLLVANTSTGQTGLFSNAGSANGVRFGPNNRGIYVGIGPGWTETTLASNSYNANEWVMITVVYDRQGLLSSGSPRLVVYINGEYKQYANLSAQTSMTTGTANLVRGTCCTRFIGKLANFSVYDTALTGSQVSQNYNATKGRFGL